VNTLGRKGEGCQCFFWARKNGQRKKRREKKPYRLAEKIKKREGESPNFPPFSQPPSPRGGKEGGGEGPFHPRGQEEGNGRRISSILWPSKGGMLPSTKFKGRGWKPFSEPAREKKGTPPGWLAWKRRTEEKGFIPSTVRPMGKKEETVGGKKGEKGRGGFPLISCCDGQKKNQKKRKEGSAARLFQFRLAGKKRRQNLDPEKRRGEEASVLRGREKGKNLDTFVRRGEEVVGERKRSLTKEEGPFPLDQSGVERKGLLCCQKKNGEEGFLLLQNGEKNEVDSPSFNTYAGFSDWGKKGEWKRSFLLFRS